MLRHFAGWHGRCYKPPMKQNDQITSCDTTYSVVDVQMRDDGERMVRLSHLSCGELSEWYSVDLLKAAGWKVVAK